MPRTIRPVARCTLAGAMLAAGAGCSLAEPPTFSLVEAAVTERSDEGVVVTFVLEGRNPNPDPLPLREVSYSVALDGSTVFSGRRSAGATLPRYGSQRIELPAAARLDEPGVAALEQGARFAIDARLRYLAPGLLSEVLFDAGLRRPSVNISERGTFVPDDAAANAPNATPSDAERRETPEPPASDEPSDG